VSEAPASRSEVAERLAEASAGGSPLSPRGGGTHSRVGHPDGRPGRLLSTERLGRLIDYTPQDLTITVEAGMPVDRLNDIAAEQGQLWPQIDAGSGSSVGGVLASAASGLSRLRFGPVRDSLLQVVVATGDGRVVTAGGRTVKGVSGYDLPRLMTGSFGSLGVIVEATLKLWPRPPARQWYLRAGADALAAGRALLTDAYRPGAVIVTPDTTYVELVGQPEDVVAPEGFRPADPPARPAGDGLVRAAVSPARLADVVQALRTLELPFAAQLGVGTCAVGVESAQQIHEVRERALALAGHAVVEDAPAALRADPWGPPPPGLEIMRRLKTAFDPAGVLNPGLMPGGI
jgi:glycolate oxidase FAD binding subunit